MRGLIGRAAVAVAAAAGAGVLAAGMVTVAAGATAAEAAATVAGVEAPLPAGAASDPAAGVGSVSCASAGNCTAVGGYTDTSGNPQGLLLTQTAGTWATGVEAPLPAGAGTEPLVVLVSVSCTSAGNCTAVGRYTDSSGNPQGLLLTQTAGTWATGVKAPLPANANSNPFVAPSSVSCASAGNCTAVGFYTDSSGNQQGLLLTQTAGTWATGVEAPLPAGATANPDVFLASVSCASAGNCTAVGNYRDSSGNPQGVLLTQTAGTWATGTEAPRPANAGTNPGVSVASVSCASAGNCTAVGSYADTSGHFQGLLLTQTAGTWATGTEAPPPANAGTNPGVALNSVSCASAGNCTTVGSYADTSGHQQGLLVTQTQAASPDLSLANTGSPNPVDRGHNLTYTITARNTGGQAAHSVRVTDRLPASTRFGSVSTTRGSCIRLTDTEPKTMGGTVICRIRQLAANDSATATVTVRRS